MSVVRRGTLLAMVAGLLLSSQAAFAYVRAVTGIGVPVAWKSPCVTMQIELTNPPPALTAERYWNASNLAARAWSHDDVSCTGLSITMAEAPSGSEVGFDGKNVVLFRQSEWCRQPASEDPSRSTCYAANVMAVTSLTKRISTGEIVDADMEINAVNYEWGDLVANPELAGTVVDFQNTVTHELGHVIGLAHPCLLPSDTSTPLLDNHGSPELECADPAVPATVNDATMYPAVSLSDVERRTLSPDDTQAACDIYPGTRSACEAPSPSQGCSMVRTPTEGASGLFALAVLFLARLVARWFGGGRRVSARNVQVRRVFRRRVRGLPTCLSHAGARWTMVRDPCRSRGRSSRYGL
jgi:hypothetical protein